MYKKASIALIAISLLLSLTACGLGSQAATSAKEEIPYFDQCAERFRLVSDLHESRANELTMKMGSVSMSQSASAISDELTNFALTLSRIRCPEKIQVLIDELSDVNLKLAKWYKEVARSRSFPPEEVTGAQSDALVLRIKRELNIDG